MLLPPLFPSLTNDEAPRPSGDRTDDSYIVLISSRQTTVYSYGTHSLAVTGHVLACNTCPSCRWFGFRVALMSIPFLTLTFHLLLVGYVSHPSSGLECFDYFNVALDMGCCTGCIAHHNSRGYCCLVLHRVSSILHCFSLTMIDTTCRTAPLCLYHL